MYLILASSSLMTVPHYVVVARILHFACVFMKPMRMVMVRLMRLTWQQFKALLIGPSRQPMLSEGQVLT